MHFKEEIKKKSGSVLYLLYTSSFYDSLGFTCLYIFLIDNCMSISIIYKTKQSKWVVLSLLVHDENISANEKEIYYVLIFTYNICLTLESSPPIYSQTSLHICAV